MWGSMAKWLGSAMGAEEGLSNMELFGMGKQQGLVGTGKHHGEAQATQLGLSQSQAPMMMTDMNSLMSQATAGAGQQQTPAQQIGLPEGLMGGAVPQQYNPWMQNPYWQQQPQQGLMY